MIKQTLVDVADLLDVEGTEGEPPRLGGAAARNFHPQDLECLEQVEDGAVVDRQWVRRHIDPAGIWGTSFEEGEAVGIEEVAAIGRQAQILVLHAARDSAEGSQQTAPGVMAALQNLLTGLVSGGAELGAQG
ncbi:hypothetical protein [Candidatus Chloroploca sp. Khr17]|uniref:hypothetical protein n=1 Tax=Candidatus Chloroploca sp. Khr17 TaxID=2496869 RepID=UPI00196A4965|nr:hypothetical protein [Candidatus Chloroploca sp. Khr17]